MGKGVGAELLAEEGPGQWGAGLRRPGFREGVRAPGAGRGGPPGRGEFGASGVRGAVERDGVRPGKTLGAGALSGSRCPGIAVRARARQGRGLWTLERTGPGSEDQSRAHRAGTRQLGPASASEVGTGVRGPVLELSEPGAPRAPGRVPEPRWGPDRFRRSQLGGAGYQEDPSKCLPLAPHPPRGPRGAAAASRGRINIDPAPGAGWPGGGLRSALAPAVAMATRPQASSGYIYSNYYYHC